MIYIHVISWKPEKSKKVADTNCIQINDFRDCLLGSLFKLLGKVFSNDWLQHGAALAGDEKWVQASSGISQSISSTLIYIQQKMLIVLEDISASLVNDIPLKVYDPFIVVYLDMPFLFAFLLF